MGNIELVYLYQNSFEDLLLLIEYLLENKIKPFSIKEEKEYIPNLWSQAIFPSIKQDKKIITVWRSSVGAFILKLAYYTYLSESKEKELIIFYFLLNAKKYGEKVIYLRNLNCVNKVLKIAGHVSHEVHKMKGFLRFKQTKNNFLYAKIEPDNNILGIISNHFANRLKNEYWMIKDEKRKMICLYDKHQTYFFKEEDFLKLNLETDIEEEQIKDLWLTFFKTIAIKERENKKCQRNFMPKKYWKNIIEMEEEI